MSTTSQTQAHTAPRPPAPTWTVDSTRSAVGFTIGKRLALVLRKTVVGAFSGVTGTVTLDDRAPANSRAELTVPAASIRSGHKRRDTHLRAKEFFDGDRHPAITFVSRSVEPIDEAAGRYRAVGDLTIRTVTRPTTLDIDYVAPDVDEQRPTARITATGTVNRRDFNLSWGNPMIQPDDEVHLHATIALTLAGQA